MSLLVSKFPVIINLLTVYKDFGITAAELKDYIEDGSLSSIEPAAKNYRYINILSKGETSCDGYLMVYNCDTKALKLELENKLIDFGLERDQDFYQLYSMWARFVTVELEVGGDVEVLQFVSHVSASLEYLHLSHAERSRYATGNIVNLEGYGTCFSKEYESYMDRPLFRKGYDGLISLWKTGGSHLNYFMPDKYSSEYFTVNEIRFAPQVLPGVGDVLPYDDVPLFSGFDVKPDYMYLFA